MDKSKEDKNKASQILGVSQRTLYRKLFDASADLSDSRALCMTESDPSSLN